MDIAEREWLELEAGEGRQVDVGDAVELELLEGTKASQRLKAFRGAAVEAPDAKASNDATPGLDAVERARVV